MAEAAVSKRVLGHAPPRENFLLHSKTLFFSSYKHLHIDGFCTEYKNEQTTVLLVVPSSFQIPKHSAENINIQYHMLSKALHACAHKHLDIIITGQNLASKLTGKVRYLTLQQSSYSGRVNTWP